MPGLTTRVLNIVGTCALYFVGALIIAFFAALSWPTICGYAPKANQQEAKIALAQAYHAQKEHYSEFSKYSFSILPGKDVEAPSKANYIIGIPFACAKLLGIPESKAYYENSKNMSAEFEAHRSVAIEFLRNAQQPSECADWATKFEVFAVGYFKDGRALDVWRIDETKELRNLHSGL